MNFKKLIKCIQIAGYNGKRTVFMYCKFEFLCDYRSHVTVDEQTLIAQIGGILGITHGWSGKTFFVELFDTMLTVVSFYIPLL